MLKKLKNKRILFPLLGLIIALLFLIIYFAYAYLEVKQIQESITNVNITSCGEFTFSDASDSINIEDAYPMSDNVGKKTTPYSFTITNTCAITSNFTIYLVIPYESEISDNYLKYHLDTTNEFGKITSLDLAVLEPNIKNQIQSKFTYEVKTVYTLTTHSLTPETSKTFNLRLWIDKDAPNETMEKTFIASLAVIDSKKHQDTFANIILNDNGGKTTIENKTTPDFSTIADTNEGMFATPDDYGTSYYFRGAVNNNWVKFANIYWRIVRINGDSTVKLIYSGTTAPTEEQAVVMTGAGTQIGESIFNEEENISEYAGYMYTVGEQRGLSTSSTIKNYIEDWYLNFLLSYDLKIADTLFCNDRSTVVANKWAGNFSGTGIGSIGVYFGAMGRLVSDGAVYKPIGTGPNLICPHKSDAYTKSDTINGNAKLSQKIGLLTTDEVSFAGAAAGQNNFNYYLYINSSYWLGSPSFYNIDNDYVLEFYIYSMGSLYSYHVNNVYGVRPVISLSSDIVLSNGNGTWNNPYIIE